MQLGKQSDENNTKPDQQTMYHVDSHMKLKVHADVDWNNRHDKE